MVKGLYSTNHVIKNIQEGFNTIGKSTHSKYHNVSHRVLFESMVKTNTKYCLLLSCTSNNFKVNIKLF